MTTMQKPDLDYLRKSIRDIPDFPKPGIIFKDITTLISDPKAFKIANDAFIEKYRNADIDFIAVPESRGFIFGAPLAIALGAGLTLIRKPGKLPAKSLSVTYDLEYGTDTLAIHEDAFSSKSNPRVIIADDLLATGGSASATIELIKKAGGNPVSAAFLIELSFLNARMKLENAGVEVFSLVDYQGE